MLAGRLPNASITVLFHNTVFFHFSNIPPEHNTDTPVTSQLGALLIALPVTYGAVTYGAVTYGAVTYD